MAWRISYSTRGRRDLSTLPEAERAAVRTALEHAARDLGAADVKKLSGRTGEWRLRVGRWRVLLGLDNRTGVITVVRVVSRDRAYRD